MLQKLNITSLFFLIVKSWVLTIRQKLLGCKDEFIKFFDSVSTGFDQVYLIANSIGTYFSMMSLGASRIAKAYFISPMVNMEKLICDMMMWSGVSENELREKKTIATNFGETLS